MGQYIFPLTQACPIWEESALRQFLIQAHRCSAQNFHGERASIFLGWDFGKYFVAMMTQSFICRNLTTDLCFPDYLLCFQNQPIDQTAHRKK